MSAALLFGVTSSIRLLAELTASLTANLHRSLIAPFPESSQWLFLVLAATSSYTGEEAGWQEN